ncbi:hypothetical protein SDC9_102705 [bioreactor metagenome]|uniref:RHS protein conserved region domain-containing protein n=1 Tax=bioreactor metagenome TaxID=1076179 RepID=A0A645AS49_9ZZZZ
MDNRITDDGEYHYEYDRWGNTTKKYKAEGNEQHHYHYDSNHRLIRFELESDTVVRGANYHYDPFGRRVVKQMQEADEDGQLQGELQTTFFGWDGDRLVLTEKDNRQIHTIYEPGSFVPLIRVEGDKQPTKRTLAQKLQEEQGIRLNRETESLFEGLEEDLLKDRLSAFSQEWMQAAQVQPALLKALLDESPTFNSKLIHFYQCNHLGTPISLFAEDGRIDWCIELDPWGRLISEYNPNQIHQPIRLQGQHLDKESNLHYNRYRYYNPETGTYTTFDPIGLEGGINAFSFVSGNPLSFIDPLGLVEGIDNWFGHTDRGFQSWWHSVKKSPWFTESEPGFNPKKPHDIPNKECADRVREYYEQQKAAQEAEQKRKESNGPRPQRQRGERKK